MNFEYARWGVGPWARFMFRSLDATPDHYGVKCSCWTSPKLPQTVTPLPRLYEKPDRTVTKMLLGVGTEVPLMNAINCDYADVPNDKISCIFPFTLSLPIDIPCKLTRSSHPQATCPQKSHDLAFLLHACIACDGFRLGTYVIVYSHSREVWTPVRAYGDCARYWIKPLNTWP